MCNCTGGRIIWTECVNSDTKNQLISLCGMGPADIAVRKDAWEIEKLTSDQKRNARSRSLERRRPESRMMMGKTEIRLPVGNSREMPPSQDKPIRPLEENLNVATTEAPGITDEPTIGEKQLPDRLMQNEQQSIALPHQLQNITNAANRLAGSLQKAMGGGNLESTGNAPQNNLSQHEECSMRSRALLEEQRQFEVLTQQQCSTTQHRTDQYDLGYGGDGPGIAKPPRELPPKSAARTRESEGTSRPRGRNGTTERRNGSHVE